MPERVIVIGDVHGCLDELQTLVEKLGVHPGDSVILIGDLMDRGPDPVGCIQFARQSGFFGVLGNHDEKHLRWRRHEDRRAADPSYQNPMRPLPPNRLSANEALTAEDVAWLKCLPPVLDFYPGWIAVHGGLFPKHNLDAQVFDAKMRDKLLRLRWIDDQGESVPVESDTDPNGPSESKSWMEIYDGPFNVVYGHAVHSLSTPRVDERPQGVKTCGIDTGCCFGGRLTALVIEGSKTEFVQVVAKRAYSDPPFPLSP